MAGLSQIPANQMVPVIVAAVKSADDDIGVVHDHMVVATSADKVRKAFNFKLDTDLYENPGHARGWQVSLADDDPGFEIPGTTEHRYWIYTWKIEGYLEISEDGRDSELEIRRLTDLVLGAISDENIWHTAFGDRIVSRGFDELRGPALLEFVSVQFADTLCHQCTIIFRTLDLEA